MVETNDIILWIAAFVALWWLFDWINMRQEGERLPMRRAPLRMLGDVLPKLWRNKSFMLALLCLWLIGAAVAGVQAYFMRVTAGPDTMAQAPAVERSLGLTDTIPELLASELPEALPRLVQVPLGAWGTILFAVLLIAAMLRIIIDPPEVIGEETARKLKWPLGLLIGYLIVWGAIMAGGQSLLDEMGPGGKYAWAELPFMILTKVVVPGLLLAPAFALLWRLVLEIARDGVWSFVSSMQALARSWLPIAATLIAAEVLILPALRLNPPAQRYWGIAYALVPVLLVLAPWAILNEQSGFLSALKRSWRLIRLKPVDALAFGLRFTLLFAVLGGLVALAEPPASAVWSAWYAPLLDVVRNALLLLQALVLARLYVRLSEMLAEDEACATCPSARIAERLEEQAAEE